MSLQAKAYGLSRMFRLSAILPVIETMAAFTGKETGNVSREGTPEGGPLSMIISLELTRKRSDGNFTLKHSC